MATKGKSSRARKKDSLGKLVIRAGGPDAFPLVAAVCLLAVAVLVSALALVVWIYLLGVGLVFLVLAAMFFWMSWVDRARSFELRTRGVRSIHGDEVTELLWEEVERVVVVKSLLGSGGVMRITNLDDASREYRGEGVSYEFRIYGGGEKIVVHCKGCDCNPDPRRLLRTLEEARPGKVRVMEPNDDNVYFE